MYIILYIKSEKIFKSQKSEYFAQMYDTRIEKNRSKKIVSP
jgi:hypothetical protein